MHKEAFAIPTALGVSEKSAYFLANIGILYAAGARRED